MELNITRESAQQRACTHVVTGNTQTSQSIKFYPKNSAMFHAGVTSLDRWLVKKMVDVVGNPPVRISLWDGVEVTPYCENPVAVMTYCDRDALFKTIIDPELHWGDLYCSGRVEFEGDMVKFMEAIYQGISGKNKISLLRRLVSWLGHRSVFNTYDKAKENIYHHYDIGNEFYKLWLDREEMQYSCAYFPHEGMTLEAAQEAKLHHICRKLNLKPGDKVVEAGCGWGGLARFMAKNYDVDVVAYNISKEQIRYARQRADDEGLADKVEFVLDDYRNIQGEFDVFVSVGMLEHVAKRDYRELGKVIKRCLKKDGRGLMHSIGRIIGGPMNAWIERRIFPGACPPTLSEMMNIFEPNGLATCDVENMRLHYSRTIEMWAQRFEQHKEEITEMMDEEFVRAWRLYLHGSLAAFNVGELHLFQVVFSHSENNCLPLSRHHIYESEKIAATDKVKLPVVTAKEERDEIL
ncbi:MAG: class I SAM-dependent methyltransferase [Gammaproteobacteria bacterium]|nr:class I SAM-dependent methyltransferase [Gammaproteobacteria bacterium]